ncbi:MAG: 30S ribosomal protein S9 [Candidatus Thermoplasmatota archaeon]|nr:30S ribosomal protein S9 [Candidatus Thermoplasmatota archaeon]MCL5962957.1 30S ribosomal protein S9 [Candidatus Thermoplasmatota archaeon]
MNIVNESGKRKCATAHVTIKKGNGKVYINNIPLEIYTPLLSREKIMEPLLLIGSKRNEMDIHVNVKGGGVSGQASAIRTAISRGLIAYLDDPSIQDIIKGYNRYLLVNDTRRKLPKLPNGRGARSKRQKSYR